MKQKGFGVLEFLLIITVLFALFGVGIPGFLVIDERLDERHQAQQKIEKIAAIKKKLVIELCKDKDSGSFIKDYDNFLNDIEDDVAKCREGNI